MIKRAVDEKLTTAADNQQVAGGGGGGGWPDNKVFDDAMKAARRLGLDLECGRRTNKSTEQIRRRPAL